MRTIPLDLLEMEAIIMTLGFVGMVLLPFHQRLCRLVEVPLCLGILVQSTSATVMSTFHTTSTDHVQQCVGLKLPTSLIVEANQIKNLNESTSQAGFQTGRQYYAGDG